MGFWGTVGRVGAGIATGGLSEGYRYLNDQAGKGAQTAAEGAKQAQQGYGTLSDQQWARSMEGLDKAQGAYTGSNALWQNMYGSPTEGALSSWYQQNQGGLSPNNPTAARTAMNGYNTYAQNPSQAQTSMTNNAGTMGYSASQDYNNRMGGQMQNASQAERTFNPQNYQSPGASEQFAGQAQGELGHSGSMENWYANHNGDFQAQNRAGAAYGGLNAQMGVAGKTENLQHLNTGDMRSFNLSLANRQGTAQAEQSSPELQGLYRGANDLSRAAPGLENMTLGANDSARFASQQMGNLGRQGLYEQFVQSDITGRNPLKERGLDQGLARINQEMARRGAFKSGAADTAIGNMVGEFEAQDYQNRAQRAQSAQQMELGRIGAGQSLAQSSSQNKLAQAGALQGLYGATSQERMAQGSALQNLAGQRDSTQLARLGQQMQAAQGASGEGLANTGQALNYAQASDQNRQARLVGQMGLASSADQSGMAALMGAANTANMAQSQTQGRVTALGNIMNQSQASELARLAGGQAAAGQADTGFMNRMQEGRNMAHASDTDNAARVQQLYNMSQGVDQENMNRQRTAFDMGQGVDQNDWARLMGAGQMAGQVQAGNRQQQNDAFMGRMGLDSAQAGLYGQFYGMGVGASGDAQGNSLNALANYYALQGQGQNAQAALPFQIAGLGVQGYKAYKGVQG